MDLLPVLERKGFAAAVIDALSSHICVVDGDSRIVSVNRAWRNFALQNPPIAANVGIGTRYLDVCDRASDHGSEDAARFAAGLRSVLERRSERFSMEYPCHSPTENRWFLGNVTPLEEGQSGAVVSHMTITERKLLELQLVKAASTDALTGLPNRRYFLETANREVERVSRFATPASVAMIDLDHFKAVNDSHGHGGGDEALRCLARICTPLLRQIDVLARIGGEEFAVLLPGTTEAGAAKVAEKLRQAICEAEVEHGALRFRMTASFGVAAVDPRDHDIKETLARADAALYAAKSAGRNCVMTAAAAVPPAIFSTQAIIRSAAVKRCSAR